MVDRRRSPARSLLRTDAEGRLRAPWRLLLGAVVVVLVAAGGAAVADALDVIATDLADPAASAIVGTTARSLPILGITAGLLAASRLLDRRTLRDLGVGRTGAWWADLAFGLTLGAILPVVVLAVLLATGHASVTGTLAARADASLPVAPAVSPWLGFALVLAYFVAVGVSEELLFRGYLFVNLAEGLRWFDGVGTRGALATATVATSVLFGLGHGSNPNATPFAVVLIALFGALFAASFVLTGRLAIAVGFHVAWNASVSSVVGFPVSGFTTPVTLLDVDVTGPALLTGGDFGPEGGLVAFVPLAVGAGAFAWWIRRREGALSVREAVAAPEPVGRAAEGGVRGAGPDDE